ncbi:UNVERIFIED_CONTAM: hypothetical protein GTU68_022811 [Idotea baltica]|nr:hypothetical protein [Idotea baltica]
MDAFYLLQILLENIKETVKFLL